MALGDALAGLFGGNKKRIERAAKRLSGGIFSDAEFDKVVRELQEANIPDEEIIFGLFETLKNPRIVAKYALVERILYFPSLDVSHFLQHWPHGTGPIWQGFLQLGEQNVARAIEHARRGIGDNDLFKALLSAECQAPVMIEAYFSDQPPTVPPLDEMAKIMGWDPDTLWSSIQRRMPQLTDAVNFLCDRLPGMAAGIIAMNLNISALVKELLEDAKDQGSVFAKAITAMKYPLDKFWTFLLANRKNDKVDAIRFIFLRGQVLLEPMLVAVLEGKDQSASKPQLSDIVTVFAEESQDVDEDEEEYLTAESVVQKLGWEDDEIFLACQSYSKGELGELTVLLGRHFPGLVRSHLFQQFPVGDVLMALGSKYSDRPQRCDLFLRRNKVSPENALEGILKKGNPQWLETFGQQFPATCAKALAARLPDDPNAAISVLASQPWSRRSIFLALVNKLEAEGEYEKVFGFAQSQYSFLNLEDLVIGMSEDGHPPNEVLLAFFEGTTGFLPDLLKIAKQLQVNQRDLFRLISRVGDERMEGDVNPLLSDLMARQPDFSMSLLFREMVERQPGETKSDPNKLIDYILKRCPGVKKRIGGFVELYEAFQAYYSTCMDQMAVQLQEVVSNATRRDRSIGKTLEELATYAGTVPDPMKDETLDHAAQRCNLDTGLFVRLLKGEVQQDFETLALADPSKFDRPERTVLRLMGIEHPDLKRMVEIARDVPSHYPLDAAAALWGIPNTDQMYVTVKNKLKS